MTPSMGTLILSQRSTGFFKVLQPSRTLDNLAEPLSMTLRILHVVPYYEQAWAYGGIPRLVTTMTRGLSISYPSAKKTMQMGPYARRMLAATYLSQHRFADALREAERCQTMRADDPWIWGVIGDAHIERGEYDAAFDAFDRMAAIKPAAAAYARVSYARELQGDLPGALRTMRMAAEATSAHDPESLAWHHAQLGHLHLEIGQVADARREFLAAAHAFPEHPFARAGLARVAEAGGDLRTALDIVMTMLETSPTPADLAYSGDLMAKLGQADAAERQYRLAEAAWRTDAPEPSRLARFLAEHGRRLDEAIVLGEQARIDRNDIFTADALAWAYFQTGQFDKAKSMMALALRTGTRDRAIRAHAEAISRASQGTVRPQSDQGRQARR